MNVIRSSIEIRPFISLEIALNIHEKAPTIFKTISDCQQWKIWKYAVPRQIKTGILNLKNIRGQGNFTIAFIFVSFEEKG